MSKGDTPRPVDKEKYDDNYRRVFGDKPLKLWRDAPGREPEDQPSSQPVDRGQEVTGGRAGPKTHETVGKAKANPTCPECGTEVYRRRGAYFDHEYRCPRCYWIGGL